LFAGVALALAALGCQKQNVSRAPAAAAEPPPPAATTPARKTLVMPLALLPGDKKAAGASETESAKTAANRDRPAGTPPASGTTSDPETLRDQGAITDDEIVAASEALNAAQVEQGTLARAKAKEPRLREFAEKLKADHERARREGKSLAARLSIKPKESALSSELGADAAGATKTLKNAKNDFDRLFVESQIAAQQKTLRLLDQKLIPNARNQDVKELLEGLRATVQAHLETARSLQATASASR
jgi:putative membrane protein